jgi:hypothetical protein
MARVRQDRATGNISVVAEFEVNTLGIPDDAIAIWDYEDLKKIGNEPGFPLDGYYVQMGDIDASPSRNENGGEGFKPIGSNEANMFVGVFDGKGYTINGLYINRPATSYVGFWGIISRATITGVNLIVDIIGGSSVGGLVGCAYGGGASITNSSVRGRIGGVNNQYAGGLLGYCNGGNCTIEDSYSAGSVSGGNVGGLVGYLHGAITRSYSTADVSGSAAGGLVGVNYWSPIMQCFASGNVVGGSGGGLVYYSSGSIIESYSIGRVTGASDINTLGGFREWL